MRFITKIKRLLFLAEDLIYCDGCGGYFTKPFIRRNYKGYDICKKCLKDITENVMYSYERRAIIEKIRKKLKDKNNSERLQSESKP